MLTLYIGCALSQAPPEFIKQVEALKHRLEQKYRVLHFLGLTAGTDADVYQRDIEECVAACDIFVAICDYPSTGLGYELSTAVREYRKQTLAVAHTDAKVSRLVLGIPHPCYTFRRYAALAQIEHMIDDFVSKHPLA